MPYCGKCGKQVGEADNFCHFCGNQIPPPISTGPTGQAGPSGSVPVTAPAYTQPSTVPISSYQETVIAIIPDLVKNKALGMKDSYYLIATPQRSIFIKLTSPFMQKAAQYNLDKNPAQTKSVWSRWKAQVAGPNIYSQYLSALSPDQALAESNENFALDNAQIHKVKCKFFYREDDPSEWHLEFESGSGIHKFVTGSNPEKPLKTIYAGKFSK
jgi:hypothetical protein